MKTFKEQIEKHFGAEVTMSYGNEICDTYEEISTADGYEIFVHMPGGKWSNVFPESDIYYYIDNMVDTIREHIESGGHFYVSETIAEELNMDDPNSDFWEDMCYENDLIKE